MISDADAPTIISIPGVYRSSLVIDFGFSGVAQRGEIGTESEVSAGTERAP